MPASSNPKATAKLARSLLNAMLITEAVQTQAGYLDKGEERREEDMFILFDAAHFLRVRTSRGPGRMTSGVFQGRLREAVLKEVVGGSSLARSRYFVH